MGVSVTDINKAKDQLVAMRKAQSVTRAAATRSVRRVNKKQKTPRSSIIVGAANLCSYDESGDEIVVSENLDEQSEFDKYMSYTVTKEEKTSFRYPAVVECDRENSVPKASKSCEVCAVHPSV
ncbi:hypothetical protein L916_06940 [Phytophthora nicotianae]|uniref:Uncharacterized protein n=1 Tax=Phytophthora nicotianae TaxID=4792 RepID=W2J712_PHYNI|nr:hypothetical protein L916_06940 [Phytophthora nicotianae]